MKQSDKRNSRLISLPYYVEQLEYFIMENFTGFIILLLGSIGYTWLLAVGQYHQFETMIIKHINNSTTINIELAKQRSILIKRAFNNILIF